MLEAEIYRVIEARRRELGLTQAEVSQRAKEGRSDTGPMQHLRRGKSPTARTLRSLCAALDLEFYIGPSRAGPAWGPLAISAGLPEFADERLSFVAQDFEHLDNLQRAEVVERFRIAMTWVLDSPSHAGPLPASTSVPAETLPESTVAIEPMADDAIAEMLSLLADEYRELNERGRQALAIRYWQAFPELRARTDDG